MKLSSIEKPINMKAATLTVTMSSFCSLRVIRHPNLQLKHRHCYPLALGTLLTLHASFVAL